MSEHCAGDECHAEQCNCSCLECEAATMRAERDETIRQRDKWISAVKNASRAAGTADILVTAALRWAEDRDDAALLAAVGMYKQRMKQPAG